MGNEQKVIELQRDTVLADYKPLILHDDEIGTIYTDCAVTPGTEYCLFMTVYDTRTIHWAPHDQGVVCGH